MDSVMDRVREAASFLEGSEQFSDFRASARSLVDAVAREIPLTGNTKEVEFALIFLRRNLSTDQGLFNLKLPESVEEKISIFKLNVQNVITYYYLLLSKYSHFRFKTQIIQTFFSGISDMHLHCRFG